MSATPKNTVVILGTGATIGSGYRRCGHKLPGDRGFFGHQGVQKQLSDYHALDVMLGIFREVNGKELTSVGLEEVWTFLEFLSKDIYQPLTDLTKEREEWLNRIRKPESRSDDEHFWSKFYREDRMIPTPTDIDLSLVTGWDLRRLLSRIYGEVDAPNDRKVYELLLKNREIPKDSTTTFISLNYDTVLEHALQRACLDWHYPHVQTTVARPPDSIKIQRAWPKP